MDIKTITRDELVKLMQSGTKFKLVDVLAKEHYAEEHIKGAISLPLIGLQKNAASVLPNKDEMIITYCASFSCSASTDAARELISLGYKNVLDYKGGLLDYKTAKLPLEGSLYATLNSYPQVLLNGKPVTLVGRKLKIGKRAPNFRAINKEMKDVNLADYAGKIKIISSFVSLDTPVCDLQVKEFNKIASTLSSDVVVLSISKDLPFAEARFCSANNIKNGEILSDYRYSSFGINFGLLLKENNLLARAVIILDSNNFVRYLEIVKELTTPPDYKAVLENLKSIIASLPMQISETTFEHCIPCEAGTPPLSKEKVLEEFKKLSGWELVEDTKLRKEYKFKDFIDAKYCLDILANIAEEEGHHPTFTLIYNKLKITLTTHVAGGLTDNDFFMAKVIDEVLAAQHDS